MKGKNLLIVESPAKAKTISNYLGNNYSIQSSMGHIRDLSPHILSIDVDNNYTPYYEIVNNKDALISKLKKIAKKSNSVLLATDPDREGEAIAYHLKEILKSSNKNIFRILFHEITKESIQDAVLNPIEIDNNKVDSQQMRRVLDRLAGYKISPILQKKIGGPLSAGRVQSIALKLIVEREKEILAHNPEEYWTIQTQFKGSQEPDFLSKLEKYKNKKIKIKNKEEKDVILNQLKENNYVLDTIKKTAKKKSPLPPLITSTLQQAAYHIFNYPVKRTMRIAQQLYEGIELNNKERTGLITYMRTDSYRISGPALSAVKKFIINNFGEEYHPGKYNFFGKKTKTQDAHEAIRPSLPLYKPDKIKEFLTPQQYNIYQLIWNRFLASQMQSAKIHQTTFHILNGDYLFITQGEIIKFPGFLKVLKLKTTTLKLPVLKAKEVLTLLNLNPEQNFTKPPARYTEATLVKILEKNGIGRPSTYTAIIDVLNKRDYVFKEEKKFKPSFLGIKVVEFLQKHFNDLMNINFTANLELELDKVSNGNMKWKTGIDAFYQKLKRDLGRIDLKKKTPLEIDQPCPQCNRKLVMKFSYKTKGWFTACSAYPECRYIHKNQDQEKQEVQIDKKCPECFSHLIKRFSPKTRSYFIGCSAYPKCNYIEKIKEDLGNCPDCSKPLVKRYSPKTRRRFIACSGYPDCKYIQKKSNKSE